ncbi:MAG: hypothetical protein ACRC18_07115 [Cetobacterium sp.]
MAYTNNIFRGYIDSKTIWDYSGKLDYKIDDLDKRFNEVNKVFNLNEDGLSNDEFWQEIWDMGICKSGLNTTDDLWSDTNVAKCLEGAGTYLLAKAPKDKKDSIKVYDDYNLFKRVIKEKELIRKYGEKDDEMIVFRTKKNYKLAPKESVSASDKKKYNELKAYDGFKQYLLSLTYSGSDEKLKLESKAKRKEVSKMINDRSVNGFSITDGKLYQMAQRQLPLVEDDMLQVKNSKERPIKWKSPLRDSGNEIDWSYLDMFDPEHVKALLQVNKSLDISDDMLIDVYDLIENTELTDEQIEILDMWRSDKTQQHIADVLGTTKSNISKQLDKIVNKIIDTYEKEYSYKHYYLNISKGAYKKCNKCGCIKLINEFSKNSRRKDGHENYCKKC